MSFDINTAYPAGSPVNRAAPGQQSIGDLGKYVQASVKIAANIIAVPTKFMPGEPITVYNDNGKPIGSAMVGIDKKTGQFTLTGLLGQSVSLPPGATTTQVAQGMYTNGI